MGVPKCKECEYLKVFTYPSGINYRQCKNSGNRGISGNEFRTSPKWCPLRNKSEG